MKGWGRFPAPENRGRLGGVKWSVESRGRFWAFAAADESGIICARPAAPIFLPHEDLSPPWRCWRVLRRREVERRDEEDPGVGEGCVSRRIKGTAGEAA